MIIYYLLAAMAIAIIVVLIPSKKVCKDKFDLDFTGQDRKTNEEKC